MISGQSGVEKLIWQLRVTGHDSFQTEFRFDPLRKWQIDIAFPAEMLAVEYEGATWQGGAHNYGDRFHRDVEKYNQLAILGWTLIRITADMVPSKRDQRNIKGLLLVERALETLRLRKKERHHEDQTR